MQKKREQKEQEKKDAQMKKANLSHFMEKCEECKKPDLMINQKEGTIVC